MSGTGKSINAENRLVVAQSGDGREWVVTAKGHGISFLGDKNGLKLTVMMVTQLWDYIKQWVNSIIVKLYLNKAVFFFFKGQQESSHDNLSQF